MPPHLAHEAVVVFFVLSGYVIAYVSSERERNLLTYLVSRAARVYSVVLPALVITFAVDMWLQSRGVEDGLRAYQLAAFWKYLPLFLTFTSDVWFLTEDAFSNGPFWSLCYEVWYYLAFAAGFFLRGRLRIVLLFVVLGIMGLNLWVLFPVWLAGCFVYRLHGRIRISRWLARWLVVGSAISLAAIWLIGIDLKLDHSIDRLTGGWPDAYLPNSQHFIGDWLTSVPLAVHLFAAKYADMSFGPFGSVIKRAAGYTFTLYLLHFRLLEFFRSSVW